MIWGLVNRQQCLAIASPICRAAPFMANFRLISVLLDCPLSPQLMEQYLNASTIANGTLEKKITQNARRKINL